VTPPNKKRGKRSSMIPVLLALSLLAIGLGSFVVWRQHSGVPARMTVESCRIGRMNHGNVFGLIFPDCYGRYGPVSGGSKPPLIKISSGWYGDQGHEVNVHIVDAPRHTRAINQSWYEPIFWFSIAFLSLVGAAWAVVGRLRPNPKKGQ
jgi:hypothetical protein